MAITEAIGWGFKATFRSWKLWIVGGIIFYLIVFATPAIFAMLAGIGMSGADPAAAPAADPSANPGNPVLDGLSVFVGLLLGPLLYNAALRQIKHPKVGWSSLVKNVNYLPVVGMSLLVSAITNVVILLAFFGVLGLADVSLFGGFDFRDDAEIFHSVLAILGALLAMLLVSVVIGPFFALWPWVVADRQETFGAAIRRGFKAGKANWLRLIGLSVLIFLLFLAAALPLGLGLIVVAPAVLNAQAHAYRQAVGESVPAQF
ncbi:hypothetical protein CATYP_04415 [Corynebacterium atypicum]|uniref:Glycerophosphoryl diester phosphodiesterase membrane domain-containing protein n=1 Tax=Corynebacterium atypicum TaxID=191610 RepID=A0ABN4DFC5_9CORY|nr:hypothetical protein [Corynebacterium atypicum]AIG64019.1 hypothetical protein CATYP_04415 [Corynebacterium atypicum]